MATSPEGISGSLAEHDASRQNAMGVIRLYISLTFMISVQINGLRRKNEEEININPRGLCERERNRRKYGRARGVYYRAGRARPSIADQSGKDCKALSDRILIVAGFNTESHADLCGATPFAAGLN